MYVLVHVSVIDGNRRAESVEPVYLFDSLPESADAETFVCVAAVNAYKAALSRLSDPPPRQDSWLKRIFRR